MTGAAGFIGSALSAQLLSRGHHVLGIDAFTDYYPRHLKEDHLAVIRSDPGFEFIEVDLNRANLRELLTRASVIFHFAAQPGVRQSWGETFAGYVDANIIATQRLLEAARAAGCRRFVYASSSSVYGDADTLPVRESSPLRPVSPYGVTKLAGEQLCSLYARAFDLPTVSLRYFTVYGPGQRPDMAFNRFVDAILEGEEVTIYGDGEQTRDFTYVADAVEAAISAGFLELHPPFGKAYNIGSGVRVSVNRVLDQLQAITGKTAMIRRVPRQPGDALHTFAEVSAAMADLGYRPNWSLEAGLREMVTWRLAEAGVT